MDLLNIKYSPCYKTSVDVILGVCRLCRCCIRILKSLQSLEPQGYVNASLGAWSWNSLRATAQNRLWNLALVAVVTRLGATVLHSYCTDKSL
jgi:hypothetical protein